jgi:FHA domain
MHDWIVIPLIALAGLVLGFWALRQRSSADDAHPSGSADRAASATGKASAVPVPNTTVAPHPEDRLVATLAFDGPPGMVPVKRGEVVIGRHSSDDVRIPDVRVSRHHARLVARGDGGFEIHNLTAVRSEPNPMLVNGASREHADIADGDVISLGGVSFKFQLATA